MAEILVRMKVDVWRTEKPEISWVEVREIRGSYVRYETIHLFRDEKTGKNDTQRVEHSFHRARLERVEPMGKRGEITPGRAVIHWLQDDREPIQGGYCYQMALFNCLEVINADMRAAAVRINELEDQLRDYLKEEGGRLKDPSPVCAPVRDDRGSEGGGDV